MMANIRTPCYSKRSEGGKKKKKEGVENIFPFKSKFMQSSSAVIPR